MIEIEKIVNEEIKFNLHKEYINTLAEPIDGFWENVMIGRSECYEIIYDEKVAGHFFVNSSKTLVQFHVLKGYYTCAAEIFEYVIKSDIVENAAVSTKEPEFLSLCLDYQKSVAADMYLFNDNKKIKYELDGFRNLSFRLAKTVDIATIKNKCEVAFEGYHEDLIKNDQLFVLYEEDSLLGIGEFRISKSNGQFGDIGMIVAEEYRRKGVGTYIITKLKEHCYSKKLKPMAGCDITNTISKKTLEKSGFISNHRIIIVSFN
ncbi:GNAT family N-acetyltransferase [Clostridium sp. FP2]|uniref:GNAT family N-acetyltransferase n=1 Tax=Clostridium sp. FP2 TaxID=2724481 RepID=UPI0013E9456E|nr:GNAT family N-acetyltransferase [Clostridium sp. FP2]MBZ9622466.1 GNAT family N-acetyltransferase [Clostridium sp. FP2]